MALETHVREVAMEGRSEDLGKCPTGTACGWLPLFLPWRRAYGLIRDWGRTTSAEGRKK